MIRVKTCFSVPLLLGLLAPFSAKSQYNPTFAQNGSTNTTLAEVKTNSAADGTATFILLGDGRFRFGEGNSISRQHNFPNANTSYTSKAYFVRKYKDDPPSSRAATVTTGSSTSGVTNPDVKMNACARIGTSWSPSPGKKHFTILSFTNDCSDTTVSGTIKFYYTNQQYFSTNSNDLLVYNSWISSPAVYTSDDNNYDYMLVANYSSLAKGEIRHVYLYGDVNISVSAGTALNTKFKITGLSCGTTEVSASVEAQKYPHDPNEKVVDKTSVCSKNMMPHELTYKIAFHNDGENFADSILVTDNFELRLQWPSAQLISASAPCNYLAGPNAQFKFPSIKLPGLNQTQPHLYTYDETIGWLKFSIGTVECLPPFDIIRNKAKVTFDIQPPIETTIAETVVLENTCGANNCPPSRPVKMDSRTTTASGMFIAAPNPVENQLRVSFQPQGSWALNLYDIQGRSVYSNSSSDTEPQDLRLETSAWLPGVYLLYWHDDQFSHTARIIKQ